MGGDLNNKMGLLTIGNQGWITSQETDLYAPLTPSSEGYSFSNKSITIHAPNGARLTCGPTDLLENDTDDDNTDDDGNDMEDNMNNNMNDNGDTEPECNSNDCMKAFI